MNNYKPIIVLDDDPTGTQTVHGVPIITEWSELAIKKEFEKRTPLFFILTNSRALIAEEANKLGVEIGQNIAKTGQNCWLLSRSDSTLRGHFPNEIEALAKGLAWEDDYLTILIPAFFEGNRCTKNDVHYWVEKDKWIPVGETPFAEDKTFGYKSSDLKEWVEEKTKGKIKASTVVSITLEELENGDEKSILDKINTAPKVLIINALNYEHLHVFSKIIKQSLRPIIFRTSASFVAVFGGIEKQPLLEKKDFQTDITKNGGLIVVGSHVPKTTAQLNELLKTDITAIEFNVYQFFMSDARPFVSQLIVKIDEILMAHPEKIGRGGKNVVLYTSRNVVLGKNKDENLQLSTYVSNALVTIVLNLKVRPAFLIAKGGITSSDLATKALRVKRAMVLGQIEAGIPVWQLGDETKFPNMPYIVFPGNVGSDNSLSNIYEKFK
jgi:uncharacterized protein YgbK (DUF1537 family)